MRTAEETLTQQLGRTPDARELAAHLGVSEDDVLQARQAQPGILRLLLGRTAV